MLTAAWIPAHEIFRPLSVCVHVGAHMYMGVCVSARAQVAYLVHRAPQAVDSAIYITSRQSVFSLECVWHCFLCTLSLLCMTKPSLWHWCLFASAVLLSIQDAGAFGR